MANMASVLCLGRIRIMHYFVASLCLAANVAFSPKVSFPQSSTAVEFSSSLRATDLPATDDKRISRRDWIVTAGVSLGGVAAGGAFLFEEKSKKDVMVVSNAGSSQIPLSLDEALVLIESSVDKRYLHAVVASDYESLYMRRPKTNSNSNALTTATAQDLMKSNSYALPLSVQENLNSQLEGRQIQVDHSILAHSHVDTAIRLWGRDNTLSVWPIAAADSPGAHYAWSSTSNNLADATDLIVDGIDCGRMSLEDALQADVQVLIQAEQFLLVPLSMEGELQKRLRGAFLI